MPALRSFSRRAAAGCIRKVSKSQYSRFRRNDPAGSLRPKYSHLSFAFPVAEPHVTEKAKHCQKTIDPIFNSNHKHEQRGWAMDKMKRLSDTIRTLMEGEFSGYIKINFSQGSLGRVEKSEEIDHDAIIVFTEKHRSTHREEKEFHHDNA
jgi:hypothetical protein